MTQSTPPYQTIKPTQQPTDLDQHEVSGLMSYVHILKKRKKILLGSLIFTLSIASIINLAQKPVYQASSELVLEAKKSEGSNLLSQSSSFTSDPTIFLTQFRMIGSEAFASRVIGKFTHEDRNSILKNFGVRASRKKDKPEVFSDKETASLMSAFSSFVSARRLYEGARLMTISVSGYDRNIIKRVADVTASAYIEMNYDSHVESFKQIYLLISRSLQEFSEKIKYGDLAVRKFDAEIKLLEALKIYGEKHPSVVSLRAQIQERSDSIKNGIHHFSKLERGQRNNLEILKEPHLELEELNTIEADLYNLKPIFEQEVRTSREMYNSVNKRLQEYEIGSGGQTWLDAKIITPASVPNKPIYPNKPLNLILALIVGLFMGMGLVFFLESLDSSLRSTDDVRNYLKLFALGFIPEVSLDEQEMTKGIQPPAQSYNTFWLSSDAGIPLYVAEAYRMIRTNLSFGSIDTNRKVLQVTSAVKGEGKTTTVTNLGISLAQAGVRTLLIDADMRRPSLHHILKLKGVTKGLSNALTDGLSWESVVEPTLAQNLSCIVAGMIPPNPAELLSSDKFDVFLQSVKEQFDMVIIDSPPTISVSDASIIASKVDGTILVARSGFIPRHINIQAKNTLQTVHAKMIGCVLNGVKSDHQPYQYSRYYNYADYYGESKGQHSNKSKKSFGDALSIPEKLAVIKDSLFALFSNAWNQCLRILKGEQSGEGPRPSDGAP